CARSAALPAARTADCDDRTGHRGRTILDPEVPCDLRAVQTVRLRERRVAEFPRPADFAVTPRRRPDAMAKDLTPRSGSRPNSISSSAKIAGKAASPKAGGFARIGKFQLSSDAGVQDHSAMLCLIQACVPARVLDSDRPPVETQDFRGTLCT